MTSPLLVYGCGGAGREVLDIVAAINAVSPTWDVVGFADDAPSPSDRDLATRLGPPVLSAAEVEALSPDTRYVVGIAAGAVRRRLAVRLAEIGLTPATLVHPGAWVGERVALGAGTLVWAGVDIACGSVVGAHVQLHRKASIGHDVVLEDFATVLPATVVSGATRIGSEALLGTGAIVLQGLDVGAGATVGAAACVVRDVAPGTLVKGIPAREG